MTNSKGLRLGVVYVGDANYHDITLFSLASIARCHQASLDFHFMQDGYSRDFESGFVRFVEARGHRLARRHVAFQAVSDEREEERLRYTHITNTTFLRAQALDALVADYDYILYVDGDVLAFEDFHLEAVSGFNELCAAGFDLSIATGLDRPEIFANCERNGASPDFFNAGVLVVNASKWQATRAGERYVHSLRRHNICCPYFDACNPNDQCALNMMVGGDWRRLPKSWNVQKSALHTSVWATATIRHYTGRRKFLPIRRRTCDPREHALLQTLSREAGLAEWNNLYDFGVSYWLNKLRRSGYATKIERAIGDLDRRKAVNLR
jgi:lipopolysaccharide biosynthesis glycosyltransferase